MDPKCHVWVQLRVTLGESGALKHNKNSKYQLMKQTSIRFKLPRFAELFISYTIIIASITL